MSNGSAGLRGIAVSTCSPWHFGGSFSWCSQLRACSYHSGHPYRLSGLTVPISTAGRNFCGLELPRLTVVSTDETFKERLTCFSISMALPGRTLLDGAPGRSDAVWNVGCPMDPLACADFGGSFSWCSQLQACYHSGCSTGSCCSKAGGCICNSRPLGEFATATLWVVMHLST